MNDPLFFNKLAGAIISAMLLFFGLPQLATGLLGGGGHHGGHGGELHLAYPIEFQTESSGGAEAAQPEESFASQLAGAAAAAGERRAALCKSCHSFEKGGANGTGPNLWGVVGRQVAGVDGFNYTAALRGAGGDWTYERLNGYLENSQGYIPGTAMVQRVGKLQHRAEIIAYLRSLADDPAPLPSVEEAAAAPTE